MSTKICAWALLGSSPDQNLDSFSHQMYPSMAGCRGAPTANLRYNRRSPTQLTMLRLDRDRGLCLQDAIASACLIEEERAEAHFVTDQRLLRDWVGVVTARSHKVALEGL